MVKRSLLCQDIEDFFRYQSTSIAPLHSIGAVIQIIQSKWTPKAPSENHYPLLQTLKIY